MKRTTGKTRFAALSGAGEAMRTTILSVVAAALLGLGLAACGGDDDEPFLIGLSVFDSLSHFKEMRRAAKFAAADINAAGGNVTDGYYAVYTYDGEGGRSRELVEVRNREEVPVAEAEQVSRPRRDCPSP